MKLLETAVGFAVLRHGDQKRKDDKTPYFTHPVRVMEALERMGVGEVDVLAAAVLHDVVEDTQYSSEPVSLDEIASWFGEDVREYVYDLTQDKRGKRETKQEYIARFKDAKAYSCLVKIADRTDNLTDWAGMEPSYRVTYARMTLDLIEAIESNPNWVAQQSADKHFNKVSTHAINELKRVVRSIIPREAPVNDPRT